MKTVVAFDFGASSGRAIKAVFDGKGISYEEIHRFENIPINEDGHIFHDVPMILGEIERAVQKAGKVDALAFDTWGVDYGLLDESGKLISAPYHYRDSRTDGAVANACRTMEKGELYKNTGNQVMAINTLFQLLSDKNLAKANTLLFMPDLFGYFLTGNKACEYTIASTSQMLNPETKAWSDKVLNAFSVKRELFPPLTETGTVLGEYKGISVISVAGHDTQCAVAAMPYSESDGETAAFLSCGTWSLIGCETDKPILSKKSAELELSNELGANGKINYLKNISGLWLIQELRRNLNAQGGENYSYNDLEQLARKAEPFKFFVDPDAPSLASPGGLFEKICDYTEKSGQGRPESVGEAVRCIYESLAMKYKYAIKQIEEITGKSFTVLHLLGGGTKDGFLCENTADCLGIPVVAGPVEATALGNIILQLKALGEIKDIDEGRRIIRESEKIKKYTPNEREGLSAAYEKYVNIIQTHKEEN